MELHDMIDRVRDFLDEDDWRYEYEEQRKIIRANISLKCKLQSVKMMFLFNENGYTTAATCPVRADDNSRAAVMDYLTQANYGLRSGCFEMDVRDGEIRYRCYVNCKGMQDISDDVIRDSLVIPALMFERYGDGLAAVIFGFSDPDTEIRRIEGGD